MATKQSKTNAITAYAQAQMSRDGFSPMRAFINATHQRKLARQRKHGDLSITFRLLRNRYRAAAGY